MCSETWKQLAKEATTAAGATTPNTTASMLCKDIFVHCNREGHITELNLVSQLNPQWSCKVESLKPLQELPALERLGLYNVNVRGVLLWYSLIWHGREQGMCNSMPRLLNPVCVTQVSGPLLRRQYLGAARFLQQTNEPDVAGHQRHFPDWRISSSL